MTRLLLFAILLGLLETVPAALLADTPAEPDDLQAAITDLAAEDPAVRRDAEQRIRDAGRSARGLLLKAAESADPAVSHAARELLLTIPWYEPSDPPAARRILDGYGRKDVAGRREVVAELVNQVGTGAGELLLRLLTEDPSDAVRWQVVAAIQNDHRLIDIQKLRALDKEIDNTPILAARAAATAYETRGEPEAVVPLYRRIIELESRTPTPDHGAIQPILDHLIGYHLVNQHFDEAAGLLRIAIFRSLAVDGDNLNRPILRLFALHAAFGPLPGFSRDVQTYLQHLDPALQMHALAEAGGGGGQWMAAMPLRILAHSLVRRAEDPLMLTDWLTLTGWQDSAERQLRLLLRQDPAIPQQIDVHLRLAHLRGQAGDDAAAAAHLQSVLRLLDRFDGMVMRGDNRSALDWLREQLQWRQLRDARTRGDPAAIEKHVDALVRTQPTDADLLADLLPALRDLDRGGEADRLAQQAYQELKPVLDADPEDAHTLNNMAWLLARTNQRLDEALKFANWATAHSPYNSAFIDTLAEVHYMRGEPGKSVELERKALLLNPRDRFMTAQLIKYQAAASSR